MVCFLSDLIWHAVLSLAIDFLVGFRISVLDGKILIGRNHHLKSCLVCCTSRILGTLSIFFNYQMCRP